MVYQDGMTDYIADELISFYGEDYAETRNISSMSFRPRYKIYRKLLKTNYLLNDVSDSIPVGKLIALLLLHYGSITNEQFNLLGVTHDDRSIYNLANRSRRGSARYPIESKGDGVEKAYVLKPAGYGRISQELPSEYLKVNRISSASRDRKINSHNTNMLDIVYATIADGMPPFYWYGATGIRFNKSLVENISLGWVRVDLKTESEFFIPDGIMEFRTGTRNYVLIEQDMCNEGKDRLEEKNGLYGRYFDGNPEAFISTLLYNVSISARDKRALNTALPNKDKSVSALDLVRKIYEEVGMDMYKTYVRMGQMIADWDSGRKKNKKPRHFDSAFKDLKDAQASCGKPWEKMSFSDFEKHERGRAEKSLAEFRESRKEDILIHRMIQIRDSLVNTLDAEESFLRSVYMGLGLVVTHTDYYKSYKHYILPMSKGLAIKYQESFYDTIAGLTDDKNHRYVYKACGMFKDMEGNRFVLKNRSCALNTKDLVIADFYLEEISADLGGYVRAKHYLDVAEKCDAPTYLILLVASHEDAVKLEKSTEFTARYLQADPRKGDRNNLTVLFVNYVKDSARIYALGKDHEKYYF